MKIQYCIFVVIALLATGNGYAHRPEKVEGNPHAEMKQQIELCKKYLAIPNKKHGEHSPIIKALAEKCSDEPINEAAHGDKSNDH